MSINTFFHILSRSSIHLTLDGQNIKAIPASRLTDEQREFIRTNKPALVKVLRSWDQREADALVQRAEKLVAVLRLPDLMDQIDYAFLAHDLDGLRHGVDAYQKRADEYKFDQAVFARVQPDLDRLARGEHVQSCPGCDFCRPAAKKKPTNLNK